MKCRSTLSMIMILFLTAAASSQVVINEIMYNSDGTDVEFVELFNAGGSAQSLAGWYMLDDDDAHDKCYLTGTLAAGAYLVVAADINTFSATYPSVQNINTSSFDLDGTGWGLGNGSDAVRLFNGSGQLVDEVAYEDGGAWPNDADGNGPSLELLNPNADNSLPTSWDPSTVDGGTPGAVNSVYTDNILPICKNGDRNIDLPTSGDAVTVTVKAHDSEGLSKVELFVNTGSGYVSQPMFDDGSNGDEAAGDSVYSAIVSSYSSGTLVKYYAVATDDIGQQDKWPNQAPAVYHAYTVDYVPPQLMISEVLAVNNASNADEAGEYDDWLEIYNAGSESVDLGGMFVSSDFSSSQAFELPQTNLGPGEYLLVWADNDTDQGTLHADFKLASSGEEVAIFETVDHGNVRIHGWKFGRMSADVSMGFNPIAGTAPEYLATPTPGAPNESSELFSPVCINEFQSTSDFGGPDDWVEIYNRGSESFDLSSCFLSDQRNNNSKWTFPQGTVLDPGEFLVIYEDVLDFGFSSDGDDVIMLTAADTLTGLDFYDFKAQQADHSEGRFPDGVNTWQRFDEPTKGSSNQNTAVDDEQTAVPTELTLHQNYPNPFNPGTLIRYSNNKTQQVTVTVFNVLGQEVAQLENRTLQPGNYAVTFDGAHLPSGIYYYSVKAGKITRMRKMMLLK